MVDTGWKPQGALGGMEWYAQSRERQQTSDLNQAKSWMDLNKTIEDVNDYLYERKERRLKSDVNAATYEGLKPSAEQRAREGAELDLSNIQARQQLFEETERVGNQVSARAHQLSLIDNKIARLQQAGQEVPPQLYASRDSVATEHANARRKLDTLGAMVSASNPKQDPKAASTTAGDKQGSTTPGWEYEAAPGTPPKPADGPGSGGATLSRDAVTGDQVRQLLGTEKNPLFKDMGDALYGDAVANVVNSASATLLTVGLGDRVANKEALVQQVGSRIAEQLRNIEPDLRTVFLEGLSRQASALETVGPNGFDRAVGASQQLTQRVNAELDSMDSEEFTPDALIGLQGQLAAQMVVLDTVQQLGGGTSEYTRDGQTAAALRDLNRTSDLVTTTRALVEYSSKIPWKVTLGVLNSGVKDRDELIGTYRKNAVKHLRIAQNSGLDVTDTAVAAGAKWSAISAAVEEQRGRPERKEVTEYVQEAIRKMKENPDDAVSDGIILRIILSDLALGTSTSTRPTDKPNEY